MGIEYIFLALLVFAMYVITLWMSGQEGFENEGSITYEDPEQIYDDIYASIYDLIWNPSDMLKYQEVSFQDIALAEWPKASVSVLDMACGTGPHACWFQTLGVKYLGVDISESMLSKGRELCPSARFQKGDITQITLFPPKTYSHVFLLGFSVYEFSNSKILADNAYQWLQPGGWCMVHMVDPDKYDPIHNLAAPFAAFSLQKYSYDRQTTSNIYFDTFKYIGTLKKNKDEDDAVYNETLAFYDTSQNNGNKYRENKHHWVMPSKERLIDIWKTSGFRFHESVDLTRCGKEYQYIVYFTK
jgi:ubiquinone/menaquinone biosynthesis C-methylase UbiE